MIDLRNHYGFTRTPFGKDLAPSMLCHYPAHAEAVARITWCARERAVGVITGEVGAGKTVAARAAIRPGPDPAHPDLPRRSDHRHPGIHHQVVTALGGRPPTAPPPSPPRPPPCSPPNTASAAGSRSWQSTRHIC